MNVISVGQQECQRHGSSVERWVALDQRVLGAMCVKEDRQASSRPTVSHAVVAGLPDHPGRDRPYW